MKLPGFYLLFLACVLVGCSSNVSSFDEIQVVNSSNSDAILGRWDEVDGKIHFIFNDTGDFVQYDGQTTTGTFYFEKSANIIHCKINGSDLQKDAFRINVTFDEKDKNLATFVLGSLTIKVKRKTMQQ